MLHVRLLCVGKLKERYLLEGCREYEKRLGAYCHLEITELPEQRLGENPSEKEIAQALEREGAELLRLVGEGSTLIALCVEGQSLSSEELSARLEIVAASGRPRLCLAVGGSYGLAPSVKQRAQLKLSMSKMTFPHHLARLMLLEQLYRAFKITEGSRYHK